VRRRIGIAFVGGLVAAAGCVLGSPEPPGCAEDAECEDGFVCRAGACLEELTGTPLPGDAGASGDADAGDGS
jgi:Cys-rich repeat protein